MALDMLQCCHTQFAACCNLSIPMGYGWAANTTELILQTFSSVNVAVWVPFTRWTEENPINPYLFRTFWMWTHFVLVPSLQSLLVRLQSHPMVQQCTQGAPTTNSWRTRNLKRCSALCGRPPSLTLSRGPADWSRNPRPNNLWKKAWHRSQQLVRAWKSWRRRPLFPKRATQKLILALQFWDFILRNLESHFLTILALCLPVTQSSDRKMLLECQDQMVTLHAKRGLKIHSCSTPALSMARLQAHLQLWCEQTCKI